MTVPVHGLPSLLHEGLEVFIVPPRLKGPRSRVVQSASDGATGQLVSLSGVDDLDAAEGLVGRSLLAREADLPADVALHDASTLMGREVIDRTVGPVGTIEEVMVGPANDVWAVHGEKGEVLLPVIDSVVREVGEKGPIYVNVPAGLLDEEGDDGHAV